MTHSRAVGLMVLVTLMWSIAGVVSRHLEAARSFEVTFWRSAFTALALLPALFWLRGRAWLDGARRAGWPLWVSSLCWTVMFTNFMIAITLTKVASVLVTLSIAPLVTALFARAVLGHRMSPGTWASIAVAGSGIAWMFARDAMDGASMLGMAVALGVPLAGATNWTLLQWIHLHRDARLEEPEMLPAVFIGAVLSALLTLPLSWPLQASAHDLRLLGLLGVVQLAIPCMLAVHLARVLPGPEISLLALLEVLFGVLWAWWGAGEVPGPNTLTGGVLVLAALAGNEWWNLHQRRAPAHA